MPKDLLFVASDFVSILYNKTGIHTGYGAWKSVMGLKVRTFKNYKKWAPAHKDYWRWGNNSNKCLHYY